MCISVSIDYVSEESMFRLENPMPFIEMLSSDMIL